MLNYIKQQQARFIRPDYENQNFAKHSKYNKIQKQKLRKAQQWNEQQDFNEKLDWNRSTDFVCKCICCTNCECEYWWILIFYTLYTLFYFWFVFYSFLFCFFSQLVHKRFFVQLFNCLIYETKRWDIPKTVHTDRMMTAAKSTKTKTTKLMWYHISISIIPYSVRICLIIGFVLFSHRWHFQV